MLTRASNPTWARVQLHVNVFDHLQNSKKAKWRVFVKFVTTHHGTSLREFEVRDVLQNNPVLSTQLLDRVLDAAPQVPPGLTDGLEVLVQVALETFHLALHRYSLVWRHLV